MALIRSSLFLFLVLLIASCTKPVLIGSDFLEDEKASLNFKDDLLLTFHTQKTDSIPVHSPNTQLITYLLGNLDDPIFGRSSASIYAQPGLSTITTNLIGSTIDSAFLDLRYDTLGTYGTTNESVTVEVYRLNELPNFYTKYFSDDTFMANSELLGSLSFVPRPKDSITIVQSEDTIKVAPFVHIPLNASLLSDFSSQDSMVYKHIDSFWHFFNGLYIHMSMGNNTMLGFNLVNSLSSLHIYYTNGTLVNQDFKFIFTPAGVKTVHMEHDYTGKLVESSLSPDPEYQYWFVQGMSGVTTTMSIDGLADLGNVIINEAELEFYGTYPPGDLPGLFPACPFLVSQYATDTSIVNSVDVVAALNRSSGNYRSSTYETLFGGVLNQVVTGPPAIYKYDMNITSLVKDIYQGKKENIIYFNPIDKGSMPCRSVLLGPADPLFAPRLKLYYTAL